MKDKWMLTWRITRYGATDEYDSFEEAKEVFRKKIAREIPFDDCFDSIIEEQLDDSENGEEIAKFLTGFFHNTVNREDVIETEFDGEFEADIKSDSFKMKESESFGEKIYPTIESNFVFMDDPAKEYNFYYSDPYDPDICSFDFDGYDYEIILRKKTKEDYMEWVEVANDDGTVSYVRKLPDGFEE
jgi:hypothetical protein